MMSWVGCLELGASLGDAEADVTGACDIELQRLRTNENRMIWQFGRIVSFVPTLTSNFRFEVDGGDLEARAEKHSCLQVPYP